ncbi:MAG: DUF3408 domain-containing protein [Dysgonomonas sp.]
MKTKITKKDYKELFGKRVIVNNRYPVYVSGRTHDILKRMIGNIMIWKLSISTLVEDILIHHLETYSEQIKEIEIEEMERLFGKKL